MKTRFSVLLLVVAFGVLRAATVQAQTFNEDFTGATTTNNWFFYNGACLTAGTGTSTSVPGKVPGCTTIFSNYYGVSDSTTGRNADGYLVGGYAGYLGSSSAPTSTPSQVSADPIITTNGVAVGHGALRFTNGAPYGYHQNGAVVSGFTFPTTKGLEITFKTVTYLGDKGGAGADGADGISFYLLDGCLPLVGGSIPSDCSSVAHPNPIYGNGTITYPAIGAWGGSLAYTCSNSNTPYNGLVGGYIGLGIDEYGNFLNGVSNTLNETGSDGTRAGDNTASGGYYQPGRIGMRGAGNVSWLALNTAYGGSSAPALNTTPYYPDSLAHTCSTGSYFASSNTCNSCPTGAYNSTTGMCDNGGCGTGLSMGSNGMCYTCTKTGVSDPSKFSPSPPSCSVGYTLATAVAPSVSVSASTATPSNTPALNAVQKTCSSGHLWNYSNPSSPVDAGAADLTNSANTAPIMDYAAISGAYSVLPSTIKIAAETAQTRDAATPIFYDVKLTQDGKLTFAYSLNGSAYTTVIKNQDITTSNGAVPPELRFGFAGSTGGSTNVHEIMCFKALPTQAAGGSTAVNEKQSSKIQNGTTQAYFGYYNPTPTVWTGDVTANNVIDTNGVVSIAAQANWSAACDLDGVAAGKTCAKTAAAGPIAGQAASARNILTYDPVAGSGVPFVWANLNSAQQAAIGGNEATAGDRVAYLHGSKTNQIPSGAKEFRQRDSILADIVDSSPTWVGPPQLPYTGNWIDRLNSGAAPNEAGGQPYTDFVSKEQTRQNAVYVGANDGFVHGFAAGQFDSSNNFVGTSTTAPNDGSELIAYMPNAVVNAIHVPPPAAPATPSPLDFSGTNYGHAFYVDATPGTGDLFYNGKWHTWLVGGLGSGGAAIYALDVTDPRGNVSGTTAFAASTTAAKSLVIGEWDPTLTCPNQTTTSCGANMGKTFGTPLVRRLHNGQWAIIFGNGYGSSTNDAGIFVGVIDKTSGKPTFYYYSTGYAAAQTAANVTSPPANGIGYVSSADLDGDHITDYVYAGDLQGNIWRFDLTDTSASWASNWAVNAQPVFAATSGQPQPITSAIVVTIVPDLGGGHRVMLGFGTGQRTQLTNTTPITYASGTQSMYGIWDWNMTAWNGRHSAQFDALASSSLLLNNATIQRGNLSTVVFSFDSLNNEYTTGSNTVCWSGSSTCAGINTNVEYGWYADLAGGQASTGLEQVIFNPTFYNGAFIVDTTVPANNVPTTCQTNLDAGWTYAVSMATGSSLTNAFPQYHDTTAVAVQTDATGTPYVVTTTEGTAAFVYQTVSGTGGATQFNPPTNTKVKRLTWIQLR